MKTSSFSQVSRKILSFLCVVFLFYLLVETVLDWENNKRAYLNGFNGRSPDFIENQ